METMKEAVESLSDHTVVEVMPGAILVEGDEAAVVASARKLPAEDPNWGDNKTAKQADADTFHATNACPQRQSFKGGIWLGLEDYILDNTDRENIRISGITGPVFQEDDPVY